MHIAAAVAIKNGRVFAKIQVGHSDRLVVSR
jgi:hypothetical protein